MSEEQKAKPEFKARAGQIVGTIWKNERKEGQDFDTFSVNIVKSYKDKEDSWKNTNNFNLNDLVKVEIVTRECLKFLTLKTE